ncbi:M1 family metallopeptidase [Novosphingobium sp. SG720]|uniref:M1 family metallopeptidase n=1 Tax=Novosphingobium sp. SG720 TaxID=2586998 RepID=UPI001447338E|nr:M1 family metallopeptidase [Novosphingobium sp. SG720]NKJ40564.1 aminopeptidase N [Novosphingobium sp. SG720]
MRALLLAATMLAGTLAATPALAASEAKAIPAAAGTMPVGKLGNAVVPQAYRLDFTLDPAQPRFSGHAEIDVTVNEGGRYVWMHGLNLGVKRVVAKVGGKTIAGTFSQADDTGVALVTFAQALPAGTATLVFDYDAGFNDGPTGLFRVHVGDQWYSWSQFESIDARGAFPSFDQPGFKTPYTVTITTPAGQRAVSNAPEVATETRGNQTVHRFAQTLPLPSYLVAVMAGPFVSVEGTVPATPQRATPLPLRVVSTRPNADKLNFALDGTKGIVSHLENYFGQAFPFPKLDQITAPIMPGAMENAGADLYEDSLLVLDDKASTSQKRNFGMVVAHELAHQWFGDMVSPAWWDDIWLNESFANWMGFRIGNEWRPDLNIGAGALEEGFAAMRTDALLVGRPIHQPITRNSQIDAAFDTITYGKGGHVVSMIAAFMGDTKFRDGVRGYMAKHKYGNASTADFFGAMADAAGDPRILPAMQSFTDQQGVPLVTFAPAGQGKWTVTQSRYARLGTQAPAQTWGVPLCLRQGDARACQLLVDQTATVSIAGTGALVPNAGGTGYYRFELPAAQWDSLIAQGASLPGGEALATIDSLEASFMAGRATPAQLVAAARSFAANPDSYASDGATGQLIAFDTQGLLTPAAHDGLRRLVGEVRAPQLAKLGFDPRAGAHAGDDPDTQQRRVALVAELADTAEDAALNTKLAGAVDAMLAGDAKALDPAFYNSAFKAWLKPHGLAGAKTLMEKALSSEDPVLRPALLRAVGRSNDPAVAKWLVEDFSDKRLRLSEKLMGISLAIASPKTADQAFAWADAHLDSLLSSGGGIFLARSLPQVVSGFCSADKAKAIVAWRPRFANNSGALELDRAIERVQDCAVLKDQRAAGLSAELAAVK